MNTVRQEIIKKLLYTPQLSFNALWDKSIPSNKFAYHLDVLEEDGFVKKTDQTYSLTDMGKSYVTYIDGKTGQIVKQPAVIAVLVVIKDDFVLLQHRLREPFYDYWGLPAGKVEFTQFASDAAVAELLEETGLRGTITLRGMTNARTYNNDVQQFNHLLLFYRVDDVSGDLIHTREGENKWVKLSDMGLYKIIPDNEYILDACVANKGFTLIEMDRKQKNSVFVSMDNVKVTKM